MTGTGGLPDDLLLRLAVSAAARLRGERSPLHAETDQTPPGRVLDLCCEPGRHAVALAQRGFKMTGVDGIRFLLNKARQHTRQSKVKGEFVRSDMRDFERPGAFDFSHSLSTSLSYFDNPHDAKVVLRHLIGSLKPGGALVLDERGKERLAKVLQPTTSTK